MYVHGHLTVDIGGRPGVTAVVCEYAISVTSKSRPSGADTAAVYCGLDSAAGASGILPWLKELRNGQEPGDTADMTDDVAVLPSPAVGPSCYPNTDLIELLSE